MNFIDNVKALVLQKDVKEKSKDLIEDTACAILGDPVSAAKVMITLLESPLFLREQLFWAKMESFLAGVYLSEEDCGKLAAKLAEDGMKNDNALRLIECIDRAETKQKVQYLINATRCLLAGFIDRPSFFRLCHAISQTLEEDLLFLREHIEEDDILYSSYVQGLVTAGLMYQSVLDGNGEQKYSFTPIAKQLDRYAVSYNDVDRYPNPQAGLIEEQTPQIQIPALDWNEMVATDEEYKEVLEALFTGES